MASARAAQALQILRGRNGQRTEVTLSSGRHIVVWDVAWGRDDGDEFDHITTNISPGPAEPHEKDFIFTSEIATIVDPVTRETLFDGPPGLHGLSLGDQAIVKQSLEYVLHSSALSGEFETRMGVTERTVEELLNRWPAVDHCGDGSPMLAINNALNEVAHGLQISEADWKHSFTCARTDVDDVYRHWKRASGRQTLAMSTGYEIRVQINGGRPAFGEVAEHLWGTGVSFDSDGDSRSPDDRDWKELTIERRVPPLERVDIDPVSDMPLVFKVVASSRSLAERAATFLRDRTNGRLVD